MKIDPISLIRQEIAYLNSRIEHFNEELKDNYYSADSKYITQKDLNAEIFKLQDLKEEIRMLAEEFTK